MSLRRPQSELLPTRAGGRARACARDATRRHLRPLVWLALLSALVLASIMPAGAVTSSTTVTATVASAVSLTNTCTNSSGWNFGLVYPSQSVTTATGAAPNICSFTFQSSNDTSMLRTYQRDQTGFAFGLKNSWSSQGVAIGTDVNAVAIVAGSPLKQYVGTRNGHMFHSEDGGVSWADATSVAAGTHFRAITAPNATFAYAAQDTHNLERTNDGGVTWTSICTTACAAASATSHFQAITSASQGIVWAANAAGSVIYSTNADTATPSWTLQATIPGVIDIDAVTATDVYLTDGSDSIWKTTDSGATWHQMTAGSFGLGNRRLTVQRSAGVDYLYAAASDGTLVRGIINAADIALGGGISWTKLVPDNDVSGTRMNAVSSVDKDNVTFAGENGYMYRLTNASGVPTYTRLATGTRTAILALEIDASGRGLFGGTSGVIDVTVDSGTAWSLKTPAPLAETSDHRDIQAISSSMVYVVGTTVGGTALMRRTSDGGTTWPVIATGLSESLWSITIPSGTMAIAVGTNGSVVTSPDASIGVPVWTVQTPPVTEDLLSVSMVPGSTTAWAVGRNGRIIRTTNGGMNWTNQPSGLAINLNSVKAVTDQVAYVAGDNAKILRTLDGGTTWATISTGVSTVDLHGIDAPDAQTFIIGREDGSVWRSVNADAAPVASVVATAVSTGTAVSVRAISASGTSTFAFTDRSSQVRRSVDGGVGWTADSPPSTHAMLGIAMIDANTGWIAGLGGRIYKTVAAISVPDYGGASTWGNAAPATNLFGVCLQQLTGANTSADFVEDITNSPQNCQANDTDPWNPVPAAATKIAHTTVAGASGTVKLVYGFRTSATQAMGAYQSTIIYEALAPNV
ncbi:MAG: hypothetical protein H7123_06545 [Thermoleophilia bacterium]|nr:hypothetical protein [Thermoleophilia bacterium]